MKLNGGTGLRTAGITGLTIASENPVYVEGNYNVGDPAAWASEAHIGAGIIADAIILLSSAWNDINSFYDAPHDVPGNSKMDSVGRHRLSLRRRLGQVALVSASWPRHGRRKPTSGTTAAPTTSCACSRTGAGTAYVSYRGSIVSFFASRQATGTFKARQPCYDHATRNFNFDVDFLLPDKLPPGTPMFRDVNTLTFRQLLRPNQ